MEHYALKDYYDIKIWHNMSYIVNTLELLQIYMHIETKKHNMTSSTHLNYFKYTCALKLKLYNYCCVIMSSSFLCCETKTVIWQAKEKKIYSQSWTHAFLWEFFFVINRKLMLTMWSKKIKMQYVFKKLLFKTIIVFTSIYFAPYRKIPVWSNKLTL